MHADGTRIARYDLAALFIFCYSNYLYRVKIMNKDKKSEFIT